MASTLPYLTKDQRRNAAWMVVLNVGSRKGLTLTRSTLVFHSMDAVLEDLPSSTVVILALMTFTGGTIRASHSTMPS